MPSLLRPRRSIDELAVYLLARRHSFVARKKEAENSPLLLVSLFFFLKCSEKDRWPFQLAPRPSDARLVSTIFFPLYNFSCHLCSFLCFIPTCVFFPFFVDKIGYRRHDGALFSFLCSFCLKFGGLCTEGKASLWG